VSGSASSLFIDEAPETFGHNQGGCAKLDDLDLTAGDEQLERAAADSGKAAGIVQTKPSCKWTLHRKFDATYLRRLSQFFGHLIG
jgi:hypothetical protein